jgi:hypothetical protein
MSENLKKYLSDVFRKDIKDNPQLKSKDKVNNNSAHLTDRNVQKFVLDRKYSSRLDEIF